MRWAAIDSFFGEDAVQATDNFKKFSDNPDGGGPRIGVLAQQRELKDSKNVFNIIASAFQSSGESAVGLMKAIFNIINQEPFVFLGILVVISLVGVDVYSNIKKKKKKEEE